MEASAGLGEATAKNTRDIFKAMNYFLYYSMCVRI